MRARFVTARAALQLQERAAQERLITGCSSSERWSLGSPRWDWLEVIPRSVRESRVPESAQPCRLNACPLEADADEDPRELQDVAADRTEDVERLRGLADVYLKQTPPWGETPTREIGELELNQLRALGYAIP